MSDRNYFQVQVSFFHRRDGVREVPEVSCRGGNYPQQACRQDDGSAVRRTAVCTLPADTAQLETRGTASEGAAERHTATETVTGSVR